MPANEARPYLEANRNLLEATAGRGGGGAPKLAVKKLEVVALFDKLPASQHDFASFVVDAFMLPKTGAIDMCQIVVTGRFQEQIGSVCKDRQFVRTFVLVSPVPAG